MLEEILEAGYEFGEPWRFNQRSLSVVVPILRRNPGDRNYVLLQEVKDKVQIVDGGSIGKTVVKNPTGKTVFVRKGTLLKGATQERAVTVGTIVLPEMTKEVEVHCVHASRGIRAGARFKPLNVVAPRQVMDSFMARSGQGVTWGAVSQATSYFAAMAPTVEPVTGPLDDLIGVLEQTQRFKDEVEKVLEKVPGDLEDQVGVAIVDVKGVLGLERFDHADSWKAFSNSVIRNYADILAEETSDLFEVKMEKVIPAVRSFIEKLGGLKREVVAETEGSKTYALDGDDIVGEYTDLKGRVIHLIASRREEKPPRSPTPLPILLRSPTPRRSPEAPPLTTTVRPPEDWYTRYETYFKGKGAFGFLRSLSKPKTWTDLERSLDLSTKTLSRRIDEAKSLNLVNQKPRLENGRLTYRLTENGKKAIKWAEAYLR